MDVLVKWSDGSQNIVNSEHLKYKPPLKVHKAVRMKWGRVWWKGRVLDFEDSTENNEEVSSSDSTDSTDSDNMPLSAWLSTTGKSNGCDLPTTSKNSSYLFSLETEVAASCCSPRTESTPGHCSPTVPSVDATPCSNSLPEAADSCRSSSCIPENTANCSISTPEVEISYSSSSPTHGDPAISSSPTCTSPRSTYNGPCGIQHKEVAASCCSPRTESTPGHCSPTVPSVDATPCSNSLPEAADSCRSSSCIPENTANCSISTPEVEISYSGDPAISSGLMCTSPGITNAYNSPNGRRSEISTTADNTAVQEHGRVQTCSNFSCHEDIFAACSTCDCLLCFEHFVSSNSCESHNMFFDIFESNAGIKACTSMSDANSETMDLFPGIDERCDSFCSISLSEETINSTNDYCVKCTSPQQVLLHPEDFVVEGEPQIEIQFAPTIAPETNHAKNKTVKQQRNSGEAYHTEKSDKHIEGRRTKPRPKCESLFCMARKLECNEFSDEDCLSVRNAFFSVGNLQAQREWIARHIKVEAPKESTRKKRFTRFYLPKGESKCQVCKLMFLNAVGISDRQVRTVVKKLGQCSMMEKERRGGRQTKRKDKQLRDEVQRHIERFPKTESHYCRASSSFQYLSSDLNVNKMYDLYVAEHPERKASRSFYGKVLRDLKLRFHKPKKDLCGLCESYHKGNEQERNVLNSQYQRHMQEKCAVREIKNEKKTLAASNPDKFQASVYDLQQVIYLPKSGRGALFYKRRLACYNFTVYELSSKAGYCYLHHEGIAKRGANEIASNLYKYLSILDLQGKEKVALFSDGCIGQNKNSILPAMLMYFMANSSSVKQVTLYYFETNHGQSEGDAVHSTIERCLKGTGDVFLPSQLATLIQAARKFPEHYHVTEVQSSDIRDWKELGKKLHILRVRSTVQGQPVDWTKVMQVQVCKHLPKKIMIKFSHLEDTFDTIDIEDGLRRPLAEPLLFPPGAYAKAPPKLPEGKYNDLMTLCSGPTPVIGHQDHIAFYRNLPH